MSRRSRRSPAALLAGLALAASAAPPVLAAAPAASKVESLALYPGADPQPKTEHVFTYPLAEALLAARSVLQDAGFQVLAVPNSQTELYTAWKLGTQVGGGHGQALLKQGVRVQAVAVSPGETVVRFYRVTRTQDDAVMARAPRQVDPGSRFAQGARPPSDLEAFSDESDRRDERETRRGIMGDQTFSNPGNSRGVAARIENKKIWEQNTDELLENDARFANSGNMPTGDDLRARNEKGVRDRTFEKELVRRLEQFPSLEFTGGAYDVAAGRAPAGAPRLSEAFAQEGGALPFSTPAKGAAAGPCGQEVQGAAALGEPGSTLLVGELAGSREVPAAVGNLACQLASAGRRVVLGLPIPREEQGALDTYLKSAGSRADQDALLANDFWRLAPRDGHSSRAMLVLLERVRAWRAGGLPLQVVAVDARELRDNRRERAMADLLLQRRQADPQAVLLALAGNYHVRVTSGAAWNASFEPVGARLVKAGIAVKSLDTAFARGRRWACAVNLRREPECRVYAAAPTEASYSPPGRAPAVQLFDEASGEPSAEGYHGVLHVGALSASLPALPPKELLVRRTGANAGPDESLGAAPAFVAVAASGVAPRTLDAAPDGSVPQDDEGEEAPAPVTAALDPSRKPEDCGEPLFGADALFKAGGLLLLGELQGSQQAPALVSKVVCLAASQKLPVTLALEIPRAEQRRLNRYLASGGGAEDQRRLLNGAFWNRSYQDGRSSRAMLQLVERVRVQRAAGLPVELLAFDTPAQGTQHEVLMAQALLAERARQPGRLMLVLTGNNHARSTRGAAWDKDFVPMGHLLRAREPGLVALDMDHAGGKAWSCKLAPEGKVQCGAFPEGAPLELRKRFLSGLSVERGFIGAKPFVTLGKERSPEGFDGLYYVGPLNASEPATAPAVRSN